MKAILILLTVISIASISCNKQEDKSSTTSLDSGAKPYPIDTCLVSGEKLGSMGDPIVINHEGQEIKFCCDSCIPKFNKNPAKYLTKLNPHSND